MEEEQNTNTEQFLDDEDIQDQNDRIEDQQGEIDNVEWANVPEQRKQESLYTLFNKVWRSKDSSKIANLDKAELGPHALMSVRSAQFMALLGVVTRHDNFALFFKQLGEITLATSASKKGWFTELFVSQKKQTLRFNTGNNLAENKFGQFKPKKRFSLFGAGSQENVQNE